jgi:hypothetical protein
MLRIQKPCRRLNIWHATVAMALTLSGCMGGGEGNNAFLGMQRYPAKGKVLLADGKPLTAGRVVFLTDTPPGSAATDIGSDGSFEFKGASGEGLPEAKYKVHIAPAPPKTNRPTSTRPAFASKYLDEDTSGLTATVTTDESKNQFEFKLDTKNTTTASSSPGGRR